jgi:hypothetical protein
MKSNQANSSLNLFFVINLTIQMCIAVKKEGIHEGIS